MQPKAISLGGFQTLSLNLRLVISAAPAVEALSVARGAEQHYLLWLAKIVKLNGYRPRYCRFVRLKARSGLPNLL